MAEENTDPKGQEERKLTPEEIRERQEKMMEYWNIQIPFLKVQAEYEDLIASIEESRARRTMALYQVAQIVQGPKQERSLKKD